MQNLDIPLASDQPPFEGLDGVAAILREPSIVVGRQLELLNVLAGYEQQNKYAIRSATTGEVLGYMVEQGEGIGSAVLRQMMRGRRAMACVVLDPQGRVALKIARPVKWLLNSRMTVMTPQGDVVGEVRQDWAVTRRCYDLFLGKRQFGRVDAPFLAWDFEVVGRDKERVGRVDRRFGGFAREIFTDTGAYMVEMDGVGLAERAVLLACAMNIDVDYFSRHSGGGAFLPIPYAGGGVPAPGAGAPAPMPMPIIIPGVGGVGGEGVEGEGPAVGGQPGDSGLGGYPQPPPPPASGPTEWGQGGNGGGATNEWGDEGFLSDDEAGVGSSLGDLGSKVGEVFKGWFEDS
ncbi:hypothetical protein HK101_003923 [Irineochytrium annulatum]|nr:hypothetical protein HK101_003923 [Irineochytrium annulatum]